LLSEIAQHIVRAAHLLALTVVPQGLSPEPSSPENVVGAAVIAILVIAGILYGSIRLRSVIDTPSARAGAALTWLAVAAALGATLLYKGPSAPLARGIAITALPVWTAIAVTAWAAAGHFLGTDWKNRRMMALVLVVAAGALQYANAAAFLASPEAMYADALKRDPANDQALKGATAILLRTYRYDDARKRVDRCLAVQPEACGCLELRARIAVQRVSDRCLAPAPDACACQSAAIASQTRAALLDAAVADARSATAQCPERAASKTILAETLALRGENEEAEREATEAVALDEKHGRARYALALALQGQGKYDEALEQLNRAVDAGVGRDGKLLAGALALIKNDLDAAERWLQPLAGSASRDAVAAYNLALIADRRSNFNAARQGYLSALRIDPCYSSARYNLAHLTWKAGVKEEALHHARKFVENAAPDDPLVGQLSALVGEDLRAGGVVPTTP
jgi:tetratricopeptide (TPR) repeat protein